MENNSFSTNFIIRHDKKDKSVATIFVRITVNGEWTEISLKEKIKECLWEPKAEIVIGKSAHVKATNEHIDSVPYRLRQAYRQLGERDCVIGPSDVKETVLGKHKLQKNRHTLIELIEKHENQCFRHLKGGPIKNYGICNLTGERLNVSISSFVQNNHVLPVSLMAYDPDGLAGIKVRGNMSSQLAKEETDNAGTIHAVTGSEHWCPCGVGWN